MIEKFIMSKMSGYILIAIFAFIISLGVYTKGHIDGVSHEKSKQQVLHDKAVEDSAREIEKVKRESKIVYKYIRGQNDDCDIYNNVIDRLPNPHHNK